jgi:hypothetical protein
VHDTEGVWFFGLLLAFVASLVLAMLVALAGGLLHTRGHARPGRILLVSALALGAASAACLLGAGALFAELSG